MQPVWEQLEQIENCLKKHDALFENKDMDIYDFDESEKKFKETKEEYLKIRKDLQSADLRTMSLKDLHKLLAARKGALTKLKRFPSVMEECTNKLSEKIKNEALRPPLIGKVNELVEDISRIVKECNQKIQDWQQVSNAFRNGKVYDQLTKTQKFEFDNFADNVEQNIGPYEGELADFEDYCKHEYFCEYEYLPIRLQNKGSSVIEEVISIIRQYRKDIDSYGGGVHTAINTFNTVLEQIKEEIRDRDKLIKSEGQYTETQKKNNLRKHKIRAKEKGHAHTKNGANGPRISKQVATKKLSEESVFKKYEQQKKKLEKLHLTDSNVKNLQTEVGKAKKAYDSAKAVVSARAWPLVAGADMENEAKERLKNAEKVYKEKLESFNKLADELLQRKK